MQVVLPYPRPLGETTFERIKIMNEANKMVIESVIARLAERHGVSPEEVVADIQEALDAAWNAAWLGGDIHAQIAWQRLFPGGLKPTVEELIYRVAVEAKASDVDADNETLCDFDD